MGLFLFPYEAHEPDEARLTLEAGYNKSGRFVESIPFRSLKVWYQLGMSLPYSKLGDIMMMVLLDGVDRTGSEFRALLDAAEFNLTRVIPTQSPMSILEAAPL